MSEKNYHTIFRKDENAVRRGDDGFVVEIPQNEKELRLDRTTLDDWGLKSVAGLFSDATILSLVYTQITDAGLPHLAKMSKLKSISLNHTGITDDGLKNFPNLSELKTLELNFTAIGDEGLRNLPDLPNLRVLDLGRSKVTAASIPLLIEMTQRRNGDFRVSIVDERVREALAVERTRLLGESEGIVKIALSHGAVIEIPKDEKILNFVDTPIGDFDLGQIVVLFPNAEGLVLQATEVTNAALPHLAGLQKLETLSLIDLPVTDAGLRSLPELPNLKSLDLRSTDVTAASVPLLADMVVKSGGKLEVKLTNIEITQADLDAARTRAIGAVKNPPTQDPAKAAAVETVLPPHIS